MKYIKKGNAPDSLEEYKRIEGASFEEMPPNIKEELRNSLFIEQGGLCCYCGNRISPDYRSVIEHFLPKGLKQYQHLQLSYDNLLCSCDGGASDRKGKTKAQKGFFPAHCDSEKNNRVIKISPLDENCESFFSYDEEGHIYGRTKEAQKAIDVLGLDCSTLVHLRKAAINAYVDCLLSSDEEWDKKILFVMSKDKSGLYKPFCFAIAYYIRRYKMSAVAYNAAIL